MVSAGVKALPAIAVEVKIIATKHGLTEFSLSKGLTESSYFQRIVEYSYPLRLSPENDFIFSGIHENMNGCRPIEKGKQIALYQCHK